MKFTIKSKFHNPHIPFCNFLASPMICRGPWMSTVVLYCWCNQFFCFLHFCHTCSLCRVELVVQFPARGSTQMLLCLFPGVLWLWHFLYSVGPHPVTSLHIYTFVVSRAFTAGAASQAEDANSSRAPGLTSDLQGSVNVHRGVLLLVPQWQCISYFVIYIPKQCHLCCMCIDFYDLSTWSGYLQFFRCVPFWLYGCCGKWECLARKPVNYTS